MARAMGQDRPSNGEDALENQAQPLVPVPPTTTFFPGPTLTAPGPMAEVRRGKKRKRKEQVACIAPRDSTPVPSRTSRRAMIKALAHNQSHALAEAESEHRVEDRAKVRAEVDTEQALEDLSKAAQAAHALAVNSKTASSKASRASRAGVARPRPIIGKLAGGERQRRALQRKMRAAKVNDDSVHCEAGDLPYAAVDQDGFLVVFKPPGWTATTTSNRGNQRTKMQNWLLPEYGDAHPYLREDPVQAGIVHRLDIQTSGPMVVATREDTYNALCASLARQQWYKEYVTLIHGALPQSQSCGKLDYRLQVPRPRGARIWRTEVNCSGLQAETWYQAIRCYKRKVEGPQKQVVTRFYTLLRVRLITGRTHQIRVHFRELARRLGFDVCGIVGDHIYLPRSQLGEDRQFCERIFLHERKLEFPSPDPDKDPIHVLCPLPRDLRHALRGLEVDDTEGHAGSMLATDDTAGGLLGGDVDGEQSWTANAANPASATV